MSKLFGHPPKKKKKKLFGAVGIYIFLLFRNIN